MPFDNNLKRFFDKQRKKINRTRIIVLAIILLLIVLPDSVVYGVFPSKLLWIPRLLSITISNVFFPLAFLYLIASEIEFEANFEDSRKKNFIQKIIEYFKSGMKRRMFSTGGYFDSLLELVFLLVGVIWFLSITLIPLAQDIIEKSITDTKFLNVKTVKELCKNRTDDCMVFVESKRNYYLSYPDIDLVAGKKYEVLVLDNYILTINEVYE